MDPPAEWVGAFDLVVESLTVQSLPRQLRAEAIARAEVESFADGDLELVRLEDFRDPDAHRWPAEPQRTGAPPRR